MRLATGNSHRRKRERRRLRTLRRAAWLNLADVAGFTITFDFGPMPYAADLIAPRAYGRREYCYELHLP